MVRRHRIRCAVDAVRRAARRLPRAALVLGAARARIGARHHLLLRLVRGATTSEAGAAVSCSRDRARRDGRGARWLRTQDKRIRERVLWLVRVGARSLFFAIAGYLPWFGGDSAAMAASLHRIVWLAAPAPCSRSGALTATCS